MRILLILAIHLKQVCRFGQRTQDLEQLFMKHMKKVRFPIIDRFVMESIREPIWMPRGIFLKEGAAIDAVDVRSVMGRGVRIDASFLKPCEEYTLEMLKKFEEEYGQIRQGDVILLYFGWEDKYAIGQKGEEFLKDWPGLSGAAAQYLLEKKVASVGTDALALDPFGSNDYPSHQILLGNGIPIMENVMNLKKLPIFSYVIGLANKLKDGSGSPIRIVALT